MENVLVHGTPYNNARHKLVLKTRTFVLNPATRIAVIYRCYIGGEIVELQQAYYDPPTEDGSVNTLELPFSQKVHEAGIIMDVAISFINGLGYTRGRTFVELELQRKDDSVPISILCADYLTAIKPVSYPYSGVHSTLEGAGELANGTVVPDPAPATANVILFQCQANERRRLWSVMFTLAADATGGAREAMLEKFNGAVRSLVPLSTVGAGTTIPITVTRLMGVDGTVNVTLKRSLPDWIFDGGDQLRLNIGGTVGPADQLSNIKFEYESYIRE